MIRFPGGIRIEEQEVDMKRTFAVLTGLLWISMICSAQTGQPMVDSKAAGKAHPSVYNLYRAQYPFIEADSRVTFLF